jgi:poly-gamma-glutamate system protein
VSGFERRARWRLVALAVALLALWWIASAGGAAPEEQSLMGRVQAAQKFLAAWRAENGTASQADVDPWGCGLIGVEWSHTTTTLGRLEAKRTACNPAWAAQFLRWYREAGLQAGDRVAVYSSASFPGLLLSAWLAAEAAGLEPLVVVSLGASTWGANHPELPWPATEAALEQNGYLGGRADFYSLGGGGEAGGGLLPEAVAGLRAAARSRGVPLLEADSLAGMVEAKSGLLRSNDVRLLVTIGGPHSSLGDDPEALRFPPGLVFPEEARNAGNGVVAAALEAGLPVLHLLNIEGLARRVGIPFDAAPGSGLPPRVHPAWALVGLALFLGALFTHRRWRLV